MNETDNQIIELQNSGFLPQGSFEIYSWEQQFSYITQIKIDENTYFLKKLKERHDHEQDEIVNKLIHEYDTLEKYSVYFKNNQFYRIPEPIFFSKEKLLLITKGIKGIAIEILGNLYASRFKPIDNGTLKIFKHIGMFLKFFHGIESYPLTNENLNELVDYIKKRLVGRGQFDDLCEKEIISFLEKTKLDCIKNLDKYRKNPVHHDFNPTNILSDGNYINVLDFGDFKMDHAYQDLIYFKLMMDGQLGSVIKYRQDRRKALIDSFYEGYGFSLSEHKTDGLYKLYMLKNLAIFLITLSDRKKMPLFFKPSLNSVIRLKDRIVSGLDYKKTRSEIIRIIHGI